MSRFRTTIMFGQATDGASETYWTGDIGATLARTQIQDLISLRAKLLTTDQYFQGVRVSIEGQKRSSQFIIPPGGEYFFDTGLGIGVPPTGKIVTIGDAHALDQFRATLQQKFRFGANRWTNRYLSGIPDAISKTEPATYDRNTEQAWWKSLDAFREFLTKGNWYIKAQQLPPEITAFDVKGVVQQTVAPMALGVTIAVPNPAPTIADGTRVALQGFRPAKHVRAATLNGTWYVVSTDSPSTNRLNVYLRNSQNISAAAQNFTDKTTLRVVSYDYYVINQIGTQRVGIHKRGKPSTGPRGRRLSRPSLDP